MYVKELPEDAIKIKNSCDYYIDKNGIVYGIEKRNNNPHRGEYFIKTQTVNFGYKYCKIQYNDSGMKTKRVHRLVAEAFIPNPNNYPIVMHKDNNKKNNNVNNLIWGTVSENTQQAVDDGLLVNDKGFNDSQSIPCTCYNTLTNELIGHFGSFREANRETGITIGGIRYQINNPENQIRKKLYFVKYNDPPISHDIIIQIDFNTDNEIKRFTTVGKAESETGVSDSTIRNQIYLDQKPSWTKEGFYFKKEKIN